MAHIDHVDGEQRRRLDAAQETIDTLRGECGDDGHAPWCREWRALVVAERDALRVAMADLGRQTIEEAEERGARWALDACATMLEADARGSEATAAGPGCEVPSHATIGQVYLTRAEARRTGAESCRASNPAEVCRAARKEGTR
jgi:hypothetical protein